MATTVLESRNIDVRPLSRNWVARLCATTNSPALFIARLGLGLVMLPHGLQKAFGLFGGYGFHGTMGFFAMMGVPPLFAFLAIAAELLGSLGLIFGCLSRIAAFGILCNMIVAVLIVHSQFGFFMNWSGTQAGEGFEFHILAIAISCAIILRGAGRASVDRLIAAKLRS